MLFWCLYGLALVGGAAFFALSLWAFHRPRARRPAVIDYDSVIAVLEAQFIVAPQTALKELLTLLGERVDEAVLTPAASDTRAIFRAYLARL